VTLKPARPGTPCSPETSPPQTKAVFVKTFGCQMNVYDSERMLESLSREGYAATDRPEAADLVILNTCHIREKAAEKVYSDLGRLRVIKEQRAAGGKDTVIAVAGCVAQAEGREMTARQPAVDMVVGPQSYHRLPEFLARIRSGEGRLVETEFEGDSKFDALTAPRRSASPSAFLTIQEGCDKFCTFCVVPYTRGLEVSRPVSDLVAEAKALVAAGAREITLLGQNVNAYHGAGPDGGSRSLADLLRYMAEIDGLDRLRYTTSHPRDMSDDLIRAHGEIEKLMPFLHLPVQSGSDAVLTAMNRRHTAAEYLELVDSLRSARPDLALSSDFIAGFPGETDEDAAATLDLIRRVGFAQAFSFKYSPRPGTPAADREPQVPEAVKSARLQAVQALLDAQQEAFNVAMVGRRLPVLVERKGRDAGMVVGRTPYLQLVHFNADEGLIGHTVPVEITAGRQASLSGVMVTA
jgi:tRNA-2-methylthio-N6-dimethylallyladenosine synthase